jgi:TetR/AcrR family transcriptional regulator, mexJK operon transcriptional repressor
MKMAKANAPSKDGPSSRTERKRQAILEAAAEIFLQHGFLGTSMDEVAARAEVSKQTVYKQFASKEALFVEIVQSMTDPAAGRVQSEMCDPHDTQELAAELLAYAERQLTIVMTPRLMQLRRVVIGEAGRFPDLGKALYDGGPGRAIAGLSAAFARWADRGLLVMDSSMVAATHFNWLVMGEPVNQAMLLGDKAIPSAAELRRHAADAVRAFLAAYGKPGE